MLLLFFYQHSAADVLGSPMCPLVSYPHIFRIPKTKRRLSSHQTPASLSLKRKSRTTSPALARRGRYDRPFRRLIWAHLGSSGLLPAHLGRCRLIWQGVPPLITWAKRAALFSRRRRGVAVLCLRRIPGREDLPANEHNGRHTLSTTGVV